MRVGTSALQRLVAARQKDHPHACGDKCKICVGHIATSGSSPCVWGQDAGDGVFTIWERIIPMRVGTSYLDLMKAYQIQDHPHACGDKSNCLICQCRWQGSSPCVWGQGVNRFQVVVNVRIIPMRVGTRGDTVRSAVRAEDHPHACGDKIKSSSSVTSS
mgnify:CR=1 FL=1